MQDPSSPNHALLQVQKLPTGIEGFDDICQGDCRSVDPR